MQDEHDIRIDAQDAASIPQDKASSEPVESTSPRGDARAKWPWERKLLVVAVCLLVASPVLMLVFSQVGDGLFPAYRQFSRGLMDAFAAVSGIFPFAVWDFSAVALVIAAIATLVVCVMRKQVLKWFSVVLTVCSVFILIVVGGWGLNHYAPPMSNDLQLEVSQYSDQQLYEATKFYWEKAAALSDQIKRDKNADVVRQDFYELAQLAPAGYEALRETYPAFQGSQVRVKALVLAGSFLLHTGHNGIFMPLTGECNVPEDTAPCDIPFTMCHELAHRHGFAGEQEANFAGMLSSWASDDVRFRYSGYFAAFRSCYFALASNYPSKAKKLVQEDVLGGLTQVEARSYALVLHDMVQTGKYYDAYNGVLEEVGTAVNDTYLKAFSEGSGVKSYGEVVDYLCAWYVSGRG